MEILALALQVVKLAVASVAVYFCVALFRRRGGAGWLALSGLFGEPFLLLFMRLLQGGSFFSVQTTHGAAGEIPVVTYSFDFPILYYLAFVGLFLIFRQERRRGSVPDRLVR